MSERSSTFNNIFLYTSLKRRCLISSQEATNESKGKVCRVFRPDVTYLTGEASCLSTQFFETIMPYRKELLNAECFRLANQKITSEPEGKLCRVLRRQLLNRLMFCVLKTFFGITDAFLKKTIECRKFLFSVITWLEK